MKQDKNEAIFDSLAKKSTTLHHILSHRSSAPSQLKILSQDIPVILERIEIKKITEVTVDDV